MAKKNTETEIQLLPLNEVKPYEDAPFKVRMDDSMTELIESIKENGVLVPVIARPHPDGNGYEILSGQRRHKACELAEIENIPVIVKDLDDDAAIILLVDSNIHREDILPSEKAKAYEMKMEAIKRQGERTDLTSRQVGEKLSVDIVSENSTDSPRNIHRYLRLNNLVDPILEMVDEKKIPFNTGVEMSYLSAKQQAELLTTIDEEDNTIPTIEQVRQMRKYADEGKLSKTVMEVIMRTEKPEKIKLIFEEDKLRKYFPKGYTKKQIEETVMQLVEKWHKQQQKKKNEMQR